MSAYSDDHERAVRLLRRIRDWRDSELITAEQHDRMASDLETNLRTTNVFLRATLFLFGMLITLAATGLLGVMFRPDDIGIGFLLVMAGGGCFAAAVFLISNYQLYRFGIEEAFVVASIMFMGLAFGFFADSVLGVGNDMAMVLGFGVAAVVAFGAFFQFGLVYAAVIAMACVALAPFQLVDSDITRRTIAVALLALLFMAARLQRSGDDEEYPNDNYATIETAAWGGIYFLLNLKLSTWVSHPVELGPFYWITYAAIWMLPAAGLWIAVRERHRYLLDLNIALAIVTLMTNKTYLGQQEKPWDPILFGAMLTAIGFGLRRWLAAGDGGARHGYVAYRLLASERDRLSQVGGASVLQPSLHPQHAPEQPAPTYGGGRSGGAGATGSY